MEDWFLVFGGNSSEELKWRFVAYGTKGYSIVTPLSLISDSVSSRTLQYWAIRLITASGDCLRILRLLFSCNSVRAIAEFICFAEVSGHES